MSTQELVDLFRTDEQDLTLVQAARAVLAARQAKEAAEAVLKQANLTVEAAENEMIRQMDLAKCPSIKVEDGGGAVYGLSAASHASYSINAGSLQDDSVLAWLRAAGGADLMKPTVHHQTFSAFCRELEAAGNSLHSAVKRYERKIVKVRKQ